MSDLKKEEEVIIVRGIAAALQAMAMPTFDALKKVLRLFGFNLSSNQTNKREDNESNG